MKVNGGVATAFVREVDVEQGRVRVEYKAIEDNLLSPWAPIAAAMSGGKRGALFMPEKGDEVLVAFHNGDFAHPYVIGFLWNGEHKSPETTADNRVIVTPGGHQLRFEDGAKAPRVVLTSKGKRSVTLDDTPGSEKVEIKSGAHTVTLDDSAADTTVTIKAGAALGVSITMKTKPPALSISVGVGNTIDVDASGISISTPAMVTLNCNAANITASGITNLTTGVLNVNAGVSTFSGVVVASSVVASSIVSPLYTPGLGNLL